MQIRRFLTIILFFLSTHTSTVIATPRAFIPEVPQRNNQSTKTVELIKRFEGNWDNQSLKYINLDFTADEFIELIDEYNVNFKSSHNPKTHFGFIEKKDLESGSHIFVRADLHGDLKSLIENLNALKTKDLLDENYKCGDRVYLVFLGDYVDRGHHNLEVLAILASLKMENPDQVFVIQGNHETTNGKEGRIEKALEADYPFGVCLSDPKKSKKLQEFFESMPLTLYLAEAQGTEKRQYVQFTHTMVELTADPSSLLDHSHSHAAMHISKKRKPSKRFIKMALLANKTTEEAKATHKRAAIQRVSELIAMESAEIRGTPLVKSTYNWGNLFEITKIGKVDDDEWGLDPKDIKHYLLLSSDTHSVKMLFRGHDHTYKHAEIGDMGEILVTTLPVGVTSPTAKKRGHSHDVAYLMTTNPKVKKWKKQRLLRAPQDSYTEMQPFQPLQNLGTGTG